MGVAFAAVVPTTELGVRAADDAHDARWFAITEVPPLAFDHKDMLVKALKCVGGGELGGGGRAVTRVSDLIVACLPKLHQGACEGDP